jgi:hypothetical protein
MSRGVVLLGGWAHRARPLHSRSVSTLAWALELPAVAKRVPALGGFVLFTSPTCGTCHDLVERLEDAGVDVQEVPLTPELADVKARMKAETGQAHVPFAYIGGELVDVDLVLSGVRAPPTGAAAPPPSADAVGAPCAPKMGGPRGDAAAHAAFRKLLSTAGVSVTGYFRP